MKRLQLLCATVFIASSFLYAGNLQVTVTTSTYGGEYSPYNVAVMWIQNNSGAFVKTIGLWASTRKTELLSWKAQSSLDVDGLTGATRTAHGQITASWNLTGQNNTRVPNGTYQYCIEMNEQGSNGPYVRGNIVIDGTSKNRTGADSSASNGSTYLKSISVVYTDVVGITDELQAPAAAPRNLFVVPANYHGTTIAAKYFGANGTLCATAAVAVQPGQTLRLDQPSTFFASSAIKDGIYFASVNANGITTTQKVLLVH